MNKEYNYRILEKGSSMSWVKVCYIDRKDSFGLQILARDSIMNRIDYTITDEHFDTVFCTIARCDIPKFKKSMRDLAEIIQAGDHSYYTYCEKAFEI